MEEKKLVLVLDLDCTLLNSAAFKDVGKEETLFLEAFHAWEQTLKRRPLLYKLEVSFWTKFRPFAFEFVEEVSKLFDVHIYTNGTGKYADAVVSLLDPTGKLIKRDHIISRRDKRAGKRKNLAAVPGADESMCLIVDDSPGAWPVKQHKNLINVPQYHYFRWSCCQYGFPESSSYSNLNSDEDDQQGALATVLQGLKTIRSEYLQRNLNSGGSLDVRDIMAELKTQIWSGCKFAVDCNTIKEYIWELCRDLGRVQQPGRHIETASGNGTQEVC